MQAINNPTGMKGIEFVEFASPNANYMDRVFLDFGFSKLRQHNHKEVYHYKQADMNFLLNRDPSGFAAHFAKDHGPSICAMGFRVENAGEAFDAAVARGARPYEGTDKTLDLPAVYGIGDSLIYFNDAVGETDNLYTRCFKDLAEPVLVEEKGFTCVDHLTNNVYKGTLETWGRFYKDIFGFRDVRFFDIKGKKTGLYSYALQSPCGSFCIPINEGTEAKSQIEEYLREYNGPGIQHLAFATTDLLDSLDRLNGSAIETLDIDDEYYNEVFERVPNVTEDRKRVQDHQVLIDGDDDGYLLQIFTKNLFGPIFIELIQRKNHNSFGEGNFQALFNSIERDQERRGVL